jgi:hypothetical protein
MAVVVASGVALALTTGLKTADQVTGQYQYIDRGIIQFAARGSAAAATGIRATLKVNGVALIDDQLVPFAGTAGALSSNDHMILDQAVAGGRVELTFRNDSAGTLTVDYLLLFTRA